MKNPADGDVVLHVERNAAEGQIPVIPRSVPPLCVPVLLPRIDFSFDLAADRLVAVHPGPGQFDVVVRSANHKDLSRIPHAQQFRRTLDLLHHVRRPLFDPSTLGSAPVHDVPIDHERVRRMVRPLCRLAPDAEERAADGQAGTGARHVSRVRQREPVSHVKVGEHDYAHGVTP